MIIYSYKYYKYSFYDNSFGIMKGEEFMSFLEQIIERAKSDVKTIVLPESTDLRVIKAAGSGSICQGINSVKTGH